MEIDEAEATVFAAVLEAFREFLNRIKNTVFADPANPDWLLWPSDEWQRLVNERIVPVISQVFSQTMQQARVTSERFIADAAATFVGQDLPPIVESPTIPTRTQMLIFEGIAAGVAADVLLSAINPIWLPMLSVMATNGGATAVNGGLFSSARWFSDGGTKSVVKTWIAREDEKTRLTHALVDNTTVSVNDVFNVGGFPLRYPHDPFGPVSETVNCRCRLSFKFGVRNV